MRKSAGYWDKYENCYEEAKKYKSRTEFQKANGAAYNAAWKNEWMDKFIWFEESPKPRGYWDNYDHCYEEARKYKTRSEFQKGCSRAYTISRKKQWLDKFTWLIDGRVKLFTDKIDCIYYYYFEQTNSIYVGRTINKKGRNDAHLYGIDRDTVAKYAYENGFPVPEMVIIEDNLTLEQGQKQEDFWVDFYKEHKYNVLNKCKGGALGTIGCGKWSKETVFNIARQYKTKRKFQIEDKGAYLYCYKHNYIKEMDWFENGRLNPKTISKKVLQYTKDGQFITEYPSISEASRQTGIFDSQICNCCKGKFKSAGGFIWKYAS